MRYSIIASMLTLSQGFYIWILSALLASPDVTAAIREGVGTYDPYTSVIEATLFTLLALGGAFVLLYIAKIKISLLRLISLSSLFVTLYFSLMLICPLEVMQRVILCGLVSFILIILQGVVKNDGVNLLASLLNSGVIGIVLAMMFTEVQLSFILLFLSLYDIYSVFKGPISKMFSPSPKTGKGVSNLFRGLFINLGGIGIGMGDLIMYSSLIGISALIHNLFLHIAVLVGVGLGIILTLVFVRKRGMFPGLPIPSLAGLIILWVFRGL